MKDLTFVEGVCVDGLHLPSGYSSSNTKGSLSVSGTIIETNITAEQNTKSDQVSSNNPDYLLYAIVAVVVVLIAIATVIALSRIKNK